MPLYFMYANKYSQIVLPNKMHIMRIHYYVRYYY